MSGAALNGQQAFLAPAASGLGPAAVPAPTFPRPAVASPERAAFLAERSTGIGGSDAASVFGIGYGCRLRLWREKRGYEPDYPREETGPMKLGKWLEPHIADEYQRLTGRDLFVEGAHRHPDYPELLVHVDRGIACPDKPDTGVLEIKALGREMFYRCKREGLAEDYVIQEQHAMLVTGRQWGSFAVMNRDSGELLYWDVERDESICQEILTEGPIFWRQVELGPAPEMLEPDDRRCQRCEYRRSCQGAALIHVDGSSDLEQDDSLLPILAEYDERKVLLSQAESLIDETKEVLRAAMGARGAVGCGGRKVYYRPQVAMRWDTRALEAKHPELAKDFKRPSESRILRIY